MRYLESWGAPPWSDMAKPKPKTSERSVVMDSEVIRNIRQHARSHLKTEVCGVLIGEVRDGTIRVEAAIEGVNASQAGTHVTFTQDTWEHVYKIKDKEYPEDRIVGWYHSHPGFGVFLSDHDTFIHKNFFSSEDQIAWVYDPHSDEEGCFGWYEGRIERLKGIRIADRRGGEAADREPMPEPTIVVVGDEEQVVVRQEPRRAREADELPTWMRWTTTILSHVLALCIGLMIAWYVVPRVMIVGIPVDPMTGRPLENLPPIRLNSNDMFNSSPPQGSTPPVGQQKSAPSKPGSTKGNDGQRRQ